MGVGPWTDSHGSLRCDAPLKVAAARFGQSIAASSTLRNALLSACFSGDTPLLTPSGSRCIAELQPGDLVLARDENDPHGPVLPKVVEEVFVRTGRLLHLHIGGRIIKTTAEHPFYVAGRGWLDACQLRAGDLLVGHDGKFVAVEANAALYFRIWRQQAQYRQQYRGLAGAGLADQPNAFAGCDIQIDPRQRLYGA